MPEQSTKKTELELWAAFRNGNEKAFSAIFNGNIQALFRYGVKFVSDEELVKDCIQDLFVKLYNNRQNLSPTDNIRLYLFRALKNKLLDELYSHKEMLSLSSGTVAFDLAGTEEPEEEDDWEKTVRKTRLENGLKSLTPRQREAIYLRYTMEMSLEEVSNMLEMNYQSARNLIHRSIEKLRKELLLTLILVTWFFC